MNERRSIIEAFVSRDRLCVIAGLIAVTAFAWAYTIVLAGHSVEETTQGLAHVHAHSWTTNDLAMTFLMWSVMMVAMMVPTAAPMLLTLAKISRDQSDVSGPIAAVSTFLLGYVLVWTVFSGFATLAQWQLHRLALVSAEGASNHALFAGALLFGAGIFQLTPLKQACLRHCRSPMFFLMTAWRPGTWGALRMGIRHGRYCVGCCWALMALMFVAGTMNLLWAAALMGLMLAEKALPPGRWVSLLSGVGLMGWGCYVLGSPLIRA